jgi:hypothetical protein
MCRALAKFKVVKQSPPEEKRTWMGGHGDWLIEMRPEVNGYVAVDMLNVPWPDDMGDPKAGDGDDGMGRVMLFAAWSMGFLGPHTFPGNLARARQTAPAYEQSAAAEAAGRHPGVIRVRSSYAFGADDDAKILPEDYDPGGELWFLTSICRALLGARGALCYFNHGGETLFDAGGMDGMIKACAEANVPPLPLWVAQRVVRLDSQAPDWLLADTVGMEQYHGTDHEAVFQSGRYGVGDVMNFLRNASLYTTDPKIEIHSGYTTDGPGGIWRAVVMEDAMQVPPRRAIRWYADHDGGPRPPRALFPGSKPIKPAFDPPPPSGASSPTRGIGGRIKSLFGR